MDLDRGDSTEGLQRQVDVAVVVASMIRLLLVLDTTEHQAATISLSGWMGWR